MTRRPPKASPVHSRWSGAGSRGQPAMHAVNRKAIKSPGNTFIDHTTNMTKFDSKSAGVIIVCCLRYVIDGAITAIQATGSTMDVAESDQIQRPIPQTL